TNPMSLTLQILADGETTPRTYTVGIPIPGKLAGGFSYVFSAIIDGNSVSFPNVSIKDWTEVDESGNPLYPTQK
ncbi:UNVERIFIED_CONTAM: fimbrillin family protein, partial [Bacteroidetes bacterium 56_B9]